MNPSKPATLAVAVMLYGLALSPGHARSIEDDPDYRRFSGLSETAVVDAAELKRRRDAYCDQLSRTISGFPGIDHSWPQLDGKPAPKPPFDERGLLQYTGGLHSGSSFEQLMIHALDPDSQDNNPYVRITAPYVDRLKQRILARPNRLTPADVMREALQVTGGNYRLATLTAHNLFKNMTYQGRRRRDLVGGRIRAGAQNVRFPAEYGDFADKLVNLRPTPQTGVGRTDKMGVWYHAFVPMTIAAWTDDPDQGALAIDQEYLVRSLGGATNMGSPVDPDKQASDRCFARAAQAAHNARVGADGPAALAPSPHPQPASHPLPPPMPATPPPVPVSAPVAAAGGTSTTGAGGEQQQGTECGVDRQAIQRLEREYLRAFRAGDTDRLRQLKQERDALKANCP